MLVFIKKKSYEIFLVFTLILASLINFEYTLPLILVYTPHLCGTMFTSLSLYVVQNAA